MAEMEVEASSKVIRRAESDSEEPRVTLDLISNLPDEMLHIIISLLPTKTTVRTGVLSKRWCHLWCSVPIDLTVDQNLSNIETKRLAAVSKILTAHPGPFKRLFIGFFTRNCKVSPTFDKWFRSSELNCLEDLTFHGGVPKPCTLPKSAFRSAPTLRDVSLSSCHIQEIDATLLLPRLKLLRLSDVFISRLSIHRLLAGCTTLEALQLEAMHSFNNLCIDSPKLQMIGVSEMDMHHYIKEFQVLVIQDAPCLERLVVLGPFGPNSVRVVSAPKLTMLGFLRSGRCQLLTGAIPVQRIIPTGLTSYLRKIKFLVLCHIVRGVARVDEFLRSLYSKEKLYIKSEIDDYMTNVLEYNTCFPMNALFEISWSAQSYLMHEAMSQLDAK